MNEFDVDYQGFTLVTEIPTAKTEAKLVNVEIVPAVEGADDQQSVTTEVAILDAIDFQKPQVDFVEVHGNLAEEFPFHLCDESLIQDLLQIPDRLAFKIGDVAEIAQIKTYVLRYWETEFEVLHPKKSKNNQRMYSRRDVENVLLIKKLLYRDRFSIEGARAALKQLKTQVKKERKVIAKQGQYREGLQKLRELLTEIQALRLVFADRKI